MKPMSSQNSGVCCGNILGRIPVLYSVWRTVTVLSVPETSKSIQEVEMILESLENATRMQPNGWVDQGEIEGAVCCLSHELCKLGCGNTADRPEHLSSLLILPMSFSLRSILKRLCRSSANLRGLYGQKIRNWPKSVTSFPSSSSSTPDAGRRSYSGLEISRNRRAGATGQYGYLRLLRTGRLGGLSVSVRFAKSVYHVNISYLCC